MVKDLTLENQKCTRYWHYNARDPRAYKHILRDYPETSYWYFNRWINGMYRYHPDIDIYVPDSAVLLLGIPLADT